MTAPCRASIWLRIGLCAAVISLPVGLLWAAPGASPSSSSAASAKPSPSGLASVGSPAAGDADSAPAVAADAATQTLQKTTRHVLDLLKRRLDLTIEPTSLFDIYLTDEPAIQLEAERLRTLIERADERGRLAQEAAEREKKAAAKPKRGRRAPKPPPSSSAQPPPLDPALESRRAARLALDRARLAFYELSKTDRQALLDDHAKRLSENLNATAKRELNAAETEAQQAEADRKEALKAAQATKDATIKQLNEELARLHSVSKSQAEYRKLLLAIEANIKTTHESSLRLQRETKELIDAQATPVRVDRHYPNVSKLLATVRTELRHALADLGNAESDVPVAGDDPLENLPDDLDRKAIDQQRATIAKTAEVLTAEETAVRKERVRVLRAELESLTRSRLRLLPRLSSQLRDRVTGFGATGRAEAKGEGLQVWLILRYHFRSALDWFGHVRRSTARGNTAWEATGLTLRWLVPVVVFAWWRRRADEWLTEAYDESVSAARKRRGRSVAPNYGARALAFLRHVRSPIEWLLLGAALWLAVPDKVRGLLEFQLLITVLLWFASGSLAVQTIDALASEDVRGPRLPRLRTGTSALRLRSLRLVGRVVVVVGLLLSISMLTVGRGTIYVWVLSTCWFAAIPVTLVLVGWWRSGIYSRLGGNKKNSAFETWILARQKGPSSFPAALVGGFYLFAVGSFNVIRNWIVTFTLTRRILAYLFRRGMSKKAAETKAKTFDPLPEKTFATLGPETPSPAYVDSEADEAIDDIIQKIAGPGGGVFGVVGERGLGKSTIVSRIAATGDAIIRVGCPVGTMDDFKAALNRAVALDPSTDLDDFGAWIDAQDEDSAIIVDDAHHLIQPQLGGLQQFDRVLDLAQQHSHTCAWVLTFDSTIWRFLEQARGAKPLFDEVVRLRPWSEAAIVELLGERNEIAGIKPQFDGLLEDAPRGDARAEALARTQASYYRLLWDYAAGNPAVALHFWRRSLGVSKKGDVAVRLFEAPSAEELEDLPDSAVFVLRSIIQLGWASTSQIVDATALSQREVQDALRYGAAHGFLELRGERYQITWNWFRAVTQLLKRRHLIFAE